MNNKIELRYTLIISILAILLSIFSFNIPLLGLLIPCLYAVLSTTNSKSILIVLAINFLVMFNIDLKELVKFFMLNILPGITVGIFVKRQTYDKNTDKLDPIYSSTILNMFYMIVLYLIFKSFFDLDLVKEFETMINDIVTLQFEIMKNSGFDISKESLSYVGDMIINLLPCMMFFEAIILSCITYYLEMFLLSKIKYKNVSYPEFSKFSLPKNIITVYFSFYIIFLVMYLLKLDLYTELIAMNMQIIFNCLFTIQGVSVCIYYFIRWIKNKNIKRLIMLFLSLSLFGLVLVNLIGMIYSIRDFRKTA